MSTVKAVVLIPYKKGYPCTYESSHLPANLVRKDYYFEEDSDTKRLIAEELLAQEGVCSPNEEEIQRKIQEISWEHKILKPNLVEQTKVSVQDLAPA